MKRKGHHASFYVVLPERIKSIKRVPSSLFSEICFLVASCKRLNRASTKHSFIQLLFHSFVYFSRETISFGYEHTSSIYVSRWLKMGSGKRIC